MRLVLNRSRNLQKRFQLAARNPPRDRLLERRKMPVHARCGRAPRRGGRDDERPPIVGADVAPDQTAVDEPIQDACQRRSLVREPFVQLGNRRRRGCRQKREDVRLALRQPAVTEGGEVEVDSMRRAMDRRYQTQPHE
jgi:hypothetical protein